MCESKVFVLENGEEKVLAGEVSSLTVSSGEVMVMDIYGKEYRLNGVKEVRVNFLGHKVVIVK